MSNDKNYVLINKTIIFDYYPNQIKSINFNDYNRCFGLNNSYNNKPRKIVLVQIFYNQ